MSATAASGAGAGSTGETPARDPPPMPEEQASSAGAPLQPPRPPPDEAEPAPPPASTPAVDRPAAPSRNAIEIAGLVIAATTFITALAFYFGWAITAANVAYFGIDSSALGFSTQDYVLRSTDALFVPLGAIVVLALAALCVHAGVERWLAGGWSHRSLLRGLARTGAVAGAVLLALGLWGAIRALPYSPGYLFKPASPGIGIAMLAYSLHVIGLVNAAERRAGSSPRVAWRPRRMAVTLVWMLVVLSAFWTTAEFANALGYGRALGLADNLHARPAVAVFAPERLHLEGRGVTISRLSGGDSAYRYRYSGLRLLLRAGGKYFLVPEGWNPQTGRAVVLVDNPPLRFEFAFQAR